MSVVEVYNFCEGFTLIRQLVEKGGEIMKEKTYFQVTGLLFAVITALHLIRLVSGFEVNFASMVVPVWASVLGIVVAGYLAYQAFKLAK